MWSLVKNTLFIYQPPNYNINITDELIDNIIDNIEKKYNLGKRNLELPNEIPEGPSLPPEKEVIVHDFKNTEKEIDDDVRQTLQMRCVHAFDFDSTLVCQKSGQKYPIDEHDWQLQFKNVRGKIEQIHKENNIVAIFSNQSGVGKNKITLDSVKGRFRNFIDTIGIPIWCFIALGDDHFRKPSSLMWDIMIGLLEKHIQDYSQDIYTEPTKISWDISNCLYVGDAAGRTKECFSITNPKRGKDFACSDRKFAFNIGINFKTPEEYFLEQKPCSPDLWKWDGFDPKAYLDNNSDTVLNIQNMIDKPNDTQEIVILVGPPSCGKSTFCNKYFPDHVRINMDTLKTKAKCYKAAKEALQKGKSIIVDNTNSTLETRKEYISLSDIMSNPFNQKKHITKCIYFDVAKDLALHLNSLRVKMTRNGTKKLPEVSYNVYYKNLVKPTEEEGFDYIFQVPVVVNFNNNLHKKQFLERN
jgi:bifunctional polynucleotide phosphatase/kinase